MATHLPISLPIFSSSQVFLSVHHHPLPARQALLEQRIMRGQGYAVVTALDDEVDLRQHCAHLGEAGGMVTQVVGAREGVEHWEGRAGDEGCGHCRSG